MSWFKRNKQQTPVKMVEPAPPTVEIIAHKKATADQVRVINEANQKLKEVFERNHFTVKLYVATGGRAPKAKT